MPMTLVEGGSPPAPWTEEELERLRRLVEADGPGAWEEKLPHFPGRSAKGLESKYYKALLQEPDEGAAPGPAPAAPPSKRSRKCAACSGKHDCAHTCGMAQPADAPSEGATPRENATPPRLADLPWAPEEDAVLLRHVAENGPGSWSSCEALLAHANRGAGRTAGACGQRFRTYLAQTADNPLRLVGGAELVGTRIEVWWESENRWFAGAVQSYDGGSRKHHVFYDDGDEEDLDMKSTTCRKEKARSGYGKKKEGGAAAKSVFGKNCPVCDRFFTNAPAFATHMKYCGDVREPRAPKKRASAITLLDDEAELAEREPRAPKKRASAITLLGDETEREDKRSRAPKKQKQPAKKRRWVVEKVVDKRTTAVKGRRHPLVEYRVRWSGYTEADDSWEPETNLGDADLAIENFEKQLEGEAAEASDAQAEAAAKTPGCCKVCGVGEPETSKMLFCTSCDDVYHTFCLEFKSFDTALRAELNAITKKEEWHCPTCEQLGVRECQLPELTEAEAQEAARVWYDTKSEFGTEGGLKMQPISAERLSSCGKVWRLSYTTTPEMQPTAFVVRAVFAVKRDGDGFCWRPDEFAEDEEGLRKQEQQQEQDQQQEQEQEQEQKQEREEKEQEVDDTALCHPRSDWSRRGAEQVSKSADLGDSDVQRVNLQRCNLRPERD